MLDIPDRGSNEERREQILRQLRIMKREMSITSKRDTVDLTTEQADWNRIHTMFQTSKRRAIRRERLSVRLVILLDRKPDENQIQHVPNAVKRKGEAFLPYRVEPVVLHRGGPEKRRSARRHGRRGCFSCRWSENRTRWYCAG